MTPASFVDLIAANPNGLASIVAVTVKARRVNVATTHAHAASAIELLATRKGLKVLVTRPDDGSFVIGITGFKAATFHTCPECDANFLLVRGKLPAHNFNAKPCPGSGTVVTK